MKKLFIEHKYDTLNDDAFVRVVLLVDGEEGSDSRGAVTQKDMGIFDNVEEFYRFFSHE